MFGSSLNALHNAPSYTQADPAKVRVGETIEFRCSSLQDVQRGTVREIKKDPVSGRKLFMVTHSYWSNAGLIRVQYRPR